MRRGADAAGWVVYKRTRYGYAGLSHAVCTQAEWAEMQVKYPDELRLVQDGFATEPAAERHARDGMRNPRPPPGGVSDEGEGPAGAGT